MKDRIVQFYQDHKTGIVMGSVGVAVAALVTTRNTRKPKIASADLWQDPNGNYLVQVKTKNGNSAFFDITPK